MENSKSRNKTQERRCRGFPPQNSNQTRTSFERNASKKQKGLSKSARRKWKRYRLPELIRQQAVDEQLQSRRLNRLNEGKRSTETILNSMCDSLR